MSTSHSSSPTSARREIHRRDFLARSTALAALGAIPFSAARRALAHSALVTDVTVRAGSDHRAVTRTLLAECGVLGPGEVHGRRVLVVPTLSRLAAPNEGVNVSPDVLSAVCERLLRGGARRVELFSRTAHDPELVWRLSGARAAIDGLRDDRIRLVQPSASAFVPLRDIVDREAIPAERRADALRWLGDHRIARALVDADLVVNLTVARCGTSEAPTFANLRGLVGGDGADAKFACRGIGEPALLAWVVRPDVTIVDGTRPSLRRPARPDGDPLRDTVAASRNVIAIEAWTAERCGTNSATTIEQLESLGLSSAPHHGRSA